VGDIYFEVISATEISNKFQKTRFWDEKSVEDVVTLGPSAEATPVGNYIKIIATYLCRDHFIATIQDAPVCIIS
jgi:hypothetical protein